MDIFVQKPASIRRARGIGVLETHSESIFKSRLEQVPKLLLRNQLKERRLEWVVTDVVEELHRIGAELMVGGNMAGNRWRARRYKLT